MSDAAGLRLEPGPRSAIAAWSEAAYPDECGGLLLGPADSADTSVTEAVRLPNRAADRRRGFLAGPADVLAAWRDGETRGLRILGTFHSHPDAPPLPSAADTDAAWPGGITLLCPVRRGRSGDPGAWRAAPGEGEPRWLPLRIDAEPLSSGADRTP